MPNSIENKSTVDIIAELGAFIMDREGKALLQELDYRIIKTGDADDDLSHRGGTRPTHQPINP